MYWRRRFFRWICSQFLWNSLSHAHPYIEILCFVKFSLSPSPCCNSFSIFFMLLMLSLILVSVRCCRFLCCLMFVREEEIWDFYDAQWAARELQTQWFSSRSFSNFIVPHVCILKGEKWTQTDDGREIGCWACVTFLWVNSIIILFHVTDGVVVVIRVLLSFSGRRRRLCVILWRDAGYTHLMMICMIWWDGTRWVVSSFHLILVKSEIFKCVEKIANILKF